MKQMKMAPEDNEAEILTVTPRMAAGFLKADAALVEADPSKRNRTVKRTAVTRYARDMAAGNWQWNGDSVTFGVDGRIIDGRHRFLACVEASTAFRVVVVRRVSDEAFLTKDSGVRRTPGDRFHIRGCNNGNVLAMATAVMWRWERGDSKRFDAWAESPTDSERAEVFERHPGLEDFVQKSHGLAKLTSQGLAAVCWYLAAQRDSTLADAFFDALASGLNMKQDDPVYVLRERLIRDRALRPRPHVSVAAEHIVRAWNATRKNERLTKLQRPKDGAHSRTHGTGLR